MTIRNLPAGIAPSTYLESLQQNDRFKDCREFYTPTQAQIPLQVQSRKEQKGQRPGEPESEQPEPPREPPVEVLEGLRDAVQAHRQVLLIGKPGSGKTTALRRLVWEGVSAWASGRMDDQDSPILVFVELRGRDGKSAKAVLEWIQDALEMHDQDISLDEIKQLLKQDQLLLLFDGVNEASSESVSTLDTFRERYPKTPMIFTTRELGAGQSLGIEKKLEMVPLTVPQMQDFIQRRLPGQAETLLKQMGDRLRELAETPMLLNMFCKVYKLEQLIPQNRGELFRQFAQLYDEEHKRRCQYEAIAYPDFYDFRDEVLQQLAFEMMQGHEKPEGLLLKIDRTDAEKLIERVFHQRGVADAPTKVKKWLDGLVRFHLLQVASQPDQIEFHHQLFQEYYAAKALLLKLPDLTDEQLKCHYLNYLKWTEPLAIALSLIDEEDQALTVVKLALDTDLMLGARLAGEVKSSYKRVSVDLINQQPVSEKLKIFLLGLTKTEIAIDLILESSIAKSPVLDSEFINTLNKLIDIQSLEIQKEKFPSHILKKIFDLRAMKDLFGEFSGTEYAASSLPFDRLERLYQTAVQMDVGLDYECDGNLRTMYPQEFERRQSEINKTLDILDSILATSKNGHLNLKDDRIIKYLRELAELPITEVRSCVASLLGKTGDPTVVEILLKLLHEDGSSDVRYSALESIGELGESHLLPWLQQSWEMTEEREFSLAIAAIQSRCGFYNYDLYQARSKVPEPDFSPQPGSPTYNFTGPVGNLNTGTVHIEGDQIGIQHNSTAEPTE